MSKIFPRCSCTTKDGTQCGRRVKDGSQPPVCSVHRDQQKRQGQAGANHFAPVERTPLEIIKKLMRDSDPAIRLRAVEMFQKYEERLADKPSLKTDDLLHRATPDQLSALRVLLDQLTAWKSTVAQQPLRRLFPNPYDPDGEPVPEELLDRWKADDAARQQPAPRPVPQVAAPVTVTPEPAEPKSLPREYWDSVGIFEIDGVPTHSLGDDHAQRILDGTITLEDARDQQREAERELAQLENR